MNNFNKNIPVGYTLEAKVMKDLFSSDECKKIITQAEFSHKADASIGFRRKVVKSIRDTVVNYFAVSSANQWIFDRATDAILNANNHFYQFEIINFMEIQLLEYNEGGFYNWHTDMILHVDDKGNHTSRKLSFIVFLTDPSEYEGGQLVVNTQKHRVSMDQGSIIIFPSFLVHKVEPVTKGTRYTIAGWLHGPKFK